MPGNAEVQNKNDKSRQHATMASTRKTRQITLNRTTNTASATTEISTTNKIQNLRIRKESELRNRCNR